jgi:hypothetical protein
MKNKSTQKEWLVNEIKKDEEQTNLEKLNLIKEIKKIKKEDILPQKPKKLTIWERIKKVLMG